MKSKKANYVRLKRLISQDKVLLLIHKKYKGLWKVFMYALCGLSFRYFDRAYENGDIILKFGKHGPRLGIPLLWQDLLDDYVAGRMETTLYTDTAAERISEISSGDSAKVDASLDNRIREFEGRMREYEDFLFGVKLFYEGTKLVQPFSVLKATSFEENYEKVKCRGERVLGEAKNVLSEVKTSGNVDRLKEVQFPPLEKDIMPTVYPDNMPRMRLLVETYNELFPGRDREIPLTKEEHMLIMDKVIDKF
ncbi:hypothetical protein ES702_00939 [subsurface metagenome]